MLVFRAAHQGVIYFAVSLVDSTMDDPPTFMARPLEGEPWQPFLDRFSLACVDMVLWEAIEAGPHADGRDLEEGEPESLVAGLNELPFPRYDTSRWYAAADILLRVDDDMWVVVLGRTAQALDRFRDEHPGFWVELDE
jgi:hypothetical protein